MTSKANSIIHDTESILSITKDKLNEKEVSALVKHFKRQENPEPKDLLRIETLVGAVYILRQASNEDYAQGQEGNQATDPPHPPHKEKSFTKGGPA